MADGIDLTEIARGWPQWRLQLLANHQAKKKKLSKSDPRRREDKPARDDSLAIVLVEK
jgi:hypothetical protein